MSTDGNLAFGASKKIKQVGRIDLPGGGKVEVENGFAYIGHMDPPYGTSVVDVRDPKNPKIVAQIKVPEGIHSHKAAVRGDVMIINYEWFQNSGTPQAGLKVFDVSDPTKPREVSFFKAADKGVHRFTFDGRYAYLSPNLEGYVGNIVMILDLADPANPKEVGRWWMPGQWVGGGEKPDWPGTLHRCHHPIRKGDRLYVSYWHGGFVILDISDMSQPKLLSQLDWSPPYPAPTHTTLPMPGPIMDREILVVTDEEAQKAAPLPYAFMWIVDITDDTRPVPISTFRVPSNGAEPLGRFGAHQPAEQVYSNIIYVTWFSGGLRAVDLSDPYRPEEVGYYVPMPGKGQDTIQSNDVFHAENGLLYLIDRLDGLEILESSL